MKQKDGGNRRSPIPVLFCAGIAIVLALWMNHAEGKSLKARYAGNSAMAENAQPPIAVSIASSGEGEPGADEMEFRILPVYTGEEWVLFLPGFAMPENTKILYLGNGRLRTGKSGDFCVTGQRIPVIWKTNETLTFFESREDMEEICYECRIMNGGAVQSVFLNLDMPNLPTLQMEDPDGKKLTSIIDWINSSKDHHTTAEMAVFGPRGETIWLGGVAKMKARGASSFREITNGKKSYSLRLDTPAVLTGKDGAAEKWALISNREQTGLCEYYALNLFSQLRDKNSTSACDYADLYIDGSYRGLYLLTRRVDDKGVMNLPGWQYISRSDEHVVVTGDESKLAAYSYNQGTELAQSEQMPEKGGFLLEVISGETEDNWFLTHNGIRYRIKYPELCSREQVRLIGEYIQDFEDAICSADGINEKGVYFTEYADPEDLADMLLTYAYFSNQELLRTSTFLSVRISRGELQKISFGPVWDFETVPKYFSETLFDELCFYGTPEQYLLPEALWSKGDFMCAALRRAHLIQADMEEWLNGPGSEEFIEKKCEEILPSLRMDLVRYTGQDTAYQEFQQGTAEDMLTAYTELLRHRQEIWKQLWDESVYHFGDGNVSEYTAGRNNAYSREAEGEVFSGEMITISPLRQNKGEAEP